MPEVSEEEEDGFGAVEDWAKVCVGATIGVF